MNLPLRQLDFLAFDCQATGNNPSKSHLLEIGWLVFKADNAAATRSLQPKTLFIRLPEAYALPKRIQKLTGIETADMHDAVAADAAIHTLLGQAEKVARRNRMALCPTVIHFARYEMGFLKHHFHASDASATLPLEVICTHQIATRLMPALPRKGLRAVAGYLGYSVPAAKRCRAHLAATAWIWCHMVQQLAEQAEIHSLDQLQQWLINNPKPTATRRYPMPTQARSALPTGPGVYRMKRSNGDILYIGKAASLKQRVCSYFHKSRRHSESTLEMLTQAVDLDVTATPTALEAALLENDTIKQYNPPYNIALTPNHRGLFYVSRNLGQHALNRNEHFSMGPVPSVDIFASAHALGTLLAQSHPGPYDISCFMALPLNHCPGAETFEKGLSLFKKKHGNLFKKKGVGPAIRHIGHKSWLKKIQERAAASEMDMLESPDNEASADFTWSPETVDNGLTSLCRRCGFLLRRASWFHMLGESMVVWQHNQAAAMTHRALILNGGAVAHRLSIQSNAWRAALPARGDTRTRCPVHMDLETYDRLRVLTTEIRRLLSENRFDGIRLNNQVTLYPEQLRRLLLWI